MLILMTSSIEHGASEATELEALLARIAQGEKDALASLYERTHSAVYGFVMSLSHCPADAEDVLQETYINVYSAAERYVPKGKPMAWIMTIAKNLARMRLREVKKDCELPEEDWSGYLADNPSVSSDERILLQTALNILSDEQKQIVMLHAVAGIKHREIAKLLDMPIATVLSKYSRAVNKLRHAMEAE